jgi:hypothetical protein
VHPGSISFFFPDGFPSQWIAAEIVSPYKIPSHLEERENHGLEYDVKSSISVLK